MHENRYSPIDNHSNLIINEKTQPYDLSQKTQPKQNPPKQNRRDNGKRREVFSDDLDPLYTGLAFILNLSGSLIVFGDSCIIASRIGVEYQVIEWISILSGLAFIVFPYLVGKIFGFKVYLKILTVIFFVVLALWVLFSLEVI